MTTRSYRNGWSLTDEHSACSYGQPVLVAPDGTPYGVADLIIETVPSSHPQFPPTSRTLSGAQAVGLWSCESPTGNDDAHALEAAYSALAGWDR